MRRILTLILGLVLSSAHAGGLGACGVHTWHEVVSKSGSWKVTFKMISQNGQFVDPSCADITEIGLTEDNSLTYGFKFSKEADFNIAYTVTAVNQDSNFQSKACVFVVTANGPAQPDIQALSYHGAECQWYVVNGVGENFSVG
ncbi:hypothetical protein EP47_07475 [Legionella norrlandica]|uniref:Uncharacterized protein n=1 Tax=Legionella norrlandica TaxID=1498499 RepID=A0A0A2SU72_9GAMM|nr:hypothetical protein [Legionella norrlandica]KGP62949.1 hypothetical protein EP47_07475 [Legionella norrlandica]